MRVIFAVILILNTVILFAQSEVSKANVPSDISKIPFKGQATLPEDKRSASVFVIEEGFWGDKNMTEMLVKNGAKFIFTEDNDGDMYFMNMLSGKSYGKIYKFTYRPSYTGNSDTVTFIWYYKNSYDSMEGFANVGILLNKRPHGIFATCSIYPENKPPLRYKAYLKRKESENYDEIEK